MARKAPGMYKLVVNLHIIVCPGSRMLVVPDSSWSLMDVVPMFAGPISSELSGSVLGSESTRRSCPVGIQSSL